MNYQGHMTTGTVVDGVVLNSLGLPVPSSIYGLAVWLVMRKCCKELVEAGLTKPLEFGV